MRAPTVYLTWYESTFFLWMQYENWKRETDKNREWQTKMEGVVDGEREREGLNGQRRMHMGRRATVETHDDVIKMERFSALLTLCAGNSPVTGDFTSQRSVTRSCDAFFICAWINAWVNNHGAGDLRRHRAHYDVIVMDGSADDIHNALHSIGSTEGLNPLRSRIGHQLNWICPFTPIIDYIIYAERVSYTLMWIDPCAFMNNKRNLGADSI